MNFKKIIRQTIALLTDPNKAWQRLAQRNDDDGFRDDVRFFYALLAFAMSAAFAGGLIYGGKIPFVSALLKALVTGTAFFGGFWLSYSILTDVLSKKFHFTASKAQILRLIAHSMLPALALSIVIALLPQLIFLKILLIYTVYVVWEAMGKVFLIEESEQGNFVLLLSAVIVFLPILIDLLLSRVVFSAALR